MWQYLAAFESIWQDVEACGSIWQHSEAVGRIWMHVEAFGSMWQHLEAFLAESGRIWLHAAVTVTASVDGTPAAIILLVAATADTTCETT